MRPIKADLHNHLGNENTILKNGFDSVVDMSFKSLGEGGVVGLVNFEDAYSTEDNRTFDVFYNLVGSYEREDLGNAIYVPEKDMLFVRGEEIALTEQGKETHLLVLGTQIDTRIKHGRSLEATLQEAQQNAGAIILDHPFFKYGAFHNFGRGNKDILQLLQEVDALEVHNGLACLPVFDPFYFNSNETTQAFYRSIRNDFPELGAIFTSDGKSFYEVGSSYSVLEMPVSYEGLNSEELNRFLKIAVRKSQGILGRKTNSYLPSLKHVFGVILKTIAGSRKRG